MSGARAQVVRARESFETLVEHELKPTALDLRRPEVAAGEPGLAHAGAIHA